MNPPLKNCVQSFLEYETRKFEEIETFQLGEREKVYKKVLYVTMVDALARTTSHPKQGPRDRFTSFVKNFCNWQDGGRVSLIHLIRMLEKVRSPEFSKLREFAYSEIERWGMGGFVDLNRDADYQAVTKLWPKTIPKPLEGIELESITHLNLLYNYRNSLVHEMREPGQTMETHDEGKPYYQGRQADGVYNWELLYPLGFYKGLVAKALETLGGYYLRDRINPIAAFQHQTYWIEGLN